MGRAHLASALGSGIHRVDIGRVDIGRVGIGGVGIGLRPAHATELLARVPELGLLEVHSENYFAAGGPALTRLEQVRAHYPLSLHGVGLSLAGTDPLHEDHLARLENLVARTEPALISEHLSFSAHNGIHFNDLLPVPYTDEALAHIAPRIAQVQERLGRMILIENVSRYLGYADGGAEPEFMAELCARTGCGILLDVNNVYVSARNLGFDAQDYLAHIPVAAVAEYHLAGHTRRRGLGGEFLLDTHDAPVDPAVWALYRQALALIGPRPTLIEWDSALPALDTLLAEAATAAYLMESRHAHAA